MTKSVKELPKVFIYPRVIKVANTTSIFISPKILKKKMFTQYVDGYVYGTTYGRRDINILKKSFFGVIYANAHCLNGIPKTCGREEILFEISTLRITAI